MSEVTNPAKKLGASPAEISGSSTVTVACKYPSGLVLRLFKTRNQIETTPQGHREFEQSYPIEEKYVVNGPAVPYGAAPAVIIRDGYALTSIPRAFWEEWFEQNKGSDLVKNRIVYAMADMRAAEEKAKAHRDVRTGLEPMNPDGDIRNPRSRGVSVAKDTKAA